MFTLGAAEEPDLALISSPELAEPPDSKIVLTLGALDLDGGHGINFIFLVIHNHDLLLLALQPGVYFFAVFNLPDITAFPAFQLAPGRN